MSRGSFTEEEKERAQAFIRQNPHTKLPELARKFSNISESSLAKWRQEIRNGDNMGQDGGAGSEGGEKKLTDKQRLQAAEDLAADYLRTINVNRIEFAYLRKYAATTDDSARKDIEIEYLIALLDEFGCKNPQRLSMEEPVEGE